ncbi:MAG: DUF1684 domain-containing protein [Pseudomonadota bacterium]
MFDIYAQVRAKAATDPEAAWRYWWTKRSELYQKHAMSPVPGDQAGAFVHIPAFSYNPAFRLHVEVHPHSEPVLEYDLADDGRLLTEPFARTVGLKKQLGAELVLYRLQGYGGGVFLPFKDGTSGVSTYGGGRYLLDTIKGADLGMSDKDELIIDFNFAYSPSCAWSPQFVCPLAPETNTLAMKIEAGEKTPTALHPA